MNAKLTLLGTGTCQIQKHRMASSVLLEIAGCNIVYDMGRGTTQRLLELGKKNDDIHSIILSHYHADHWTDLLPFLQAGAWSKQDPRTQDLTVFGSKGLNELFDSLFQVLGREPFEREHYKVNMVQLETGPFSFKDLDFDFIDLPPCDNHGLRFEINGKRYGLTGDSYFHDQEVTFLRELDLAVIDSGHLEVSEIIELAVASQTPEIVCSHLYQELDETDLNRRAKSAGYTGKFVVGQDLMTFELG